jgi:uncharacterized membrane protein YedE/YeeE
MSDASSSSGSSGSIRRSGRTRKKKKSQIPIGIIAGVVIVILGILLSLKEPRLGLYWFTGMVFGFILQKSRFCFTASLRDPSLTGSTTVTRAVLIAFALTSIGFWAIKYGAVQQGLPVPGQSFVVPVSLATVIGAFIFGIGMVIAGGCASGTLMRVGEGFTMQILALLFFVIGSLWGAHDFGWWKLNVISNGKAVFMPDVFGWAGALVVQLLIIVCLFVAAYKWEYRKKEQSN